MVIGPNVYPANLPGFQEAIERHYAELRQLGSKVFRAFALALNLPEIFFEDKITKPLAQLRLSHYPPCLGEINDRQISLGAHTDYECFTILTQEEVEGLQVLNSASEWIAVPPIPGTFIINIGDQMARWTNDLFQSNILGQSIHPTASVTSRPSSLPLTMTLSLRHFLPVSAIKNLLGMYPLAQEISSAAFTTEPSATCNKQVLQEISLNSVGNLSL